VLRTIGKREERWFFRKCYGEEGRSACGETGRNRTGQETIGTKRGGEKRILGSGGQGGEGERGGAVGFLRQKAGWRGWEKAGLDVLGRRKGEVRRGPQGVAKAGGTLKKVGDVEVIPLWFGVDLAVERRALGQWSSLGRKKATGMYIRCSEKQREGNSMRYA